MGMHDRPGRGMAPHRYGSDNTSDDGPIRRVLRNGTLGTLGDCILLAALLGGCIALASLIR